ncbi:hypothetical protein IQ255_02170 [Pleurocapsales cyanobacterium LEGE 10410]|nr:hypothetical protein [Pleurocapsales cyanobacterium LEGE 10410]
MENSQEKEQATPAADGGLNTPIDPTQRKTGQTAGEDTRDGAEAEAPGTRNDVAGDPNQGTDAR